MHDLDRGFGQPRNDRLREQMDAGLFFVVDAVHGLIGGRLSGYQRCSASLLIYVNYWKTWR